MSALSYQTSVWMVEPGLQHHAAHAGSDARPAQGRHELFAVNHVAD